MLLSKIMYLSLAAAIVFILVLSLGGYLTEDSDNEESKPINCGDGRCNIICALNTDNCEIETPENCPEDCPSSINYNSNYRIDHAD
ncbi:MAG: hypothetical protein V1838_02100 [Patescibacteria group bacterium]